MGKKQPKDHNKPKHDRRKIVARLRKAHESGRKLAKDAGIESY
ncbi:hypothetical protein LCGC14_2959350 [marine sediment metagenome]|uniref:Uncharacterized protein n=1 Tax=marine sediment metagenome TaxID=412755 RepID=A0A0F8XDL2_9ZZZZ